MGSSVAESGEHAGAEERSVMSAYDAAAPTFERHRALPDGVPRAVRAAVLAAVGVPSPRLLDLGAGTGRFGWAFVAAGGAFPRGGGGGRFRWRKPTASGCHSPMRPSMASS